MTIKLFLIIMSLSIIIGIIAGKIAAWYWI